MKPFVTFITYYNKNLEECGDFLSKQLSQYSLVNNYYFLQEKDNEVIKRHASWGKLAKIGSKIPSHSIVNNGWVFCIDADCVILNGSYDMSFLSKVNDNVSFLVSKDWNGPCCAAMAFRLEPWSAWFVDMLDKLGDIFNDKDDEFGVGLGPKQEQNSLKVLMKYYPAIKNKVDFLPDWFISDTPNFDKPEFLWHYAAARKVEEKAGLLNFHVKRKLMQKNLEKS